VSKEIEVAALQRIVEEQANDEGLWFKSVYITESYLQSELRRLHEAAEVVIAASQQGSIATQVECSLPPVNHEREKEVDELVADFYAKPDNNPSLMVDSYILEEIIRLARSGERPSLGDLMTIDRGEALLAGSE